MQNHHSGSSDPVKSEPTSRPEIDDSQNKASMILKLSYLIMIIFIAAVIAGGFWLATSFGQ